VTPPRWRPAYVGVGSNLDSPDEQVTSGITAMQGLPLTLCILQSSLYRSAPLGPSDQPDFINAVAALLTQLDPRELLRELQSIEDAHGRTRDAVRWGPRTLDLDLLSLSDVVMEDDDLILPHPGIAERNFVLLPWSEVAPHFRVPGLSTVTQLARNISADEPRIERVV